jgi:hypothetical protein
MTHPDNPQAHPPRGLFGIGAAGLIFEAIVVLLATAAVASPGSHHPGWQLGYLFGVAGLLFLIGGMIRRRGGLVAGAVVQLLVIAAGFVTWPMYVLGVVFALVWVYYLRLWRQPAP